MHYTQKQLLKIIADKDLPELSVIKLFNVDFYTEAENYEFLLQSLKSDYLNLSRQILNHIKHFISKNPTKFTQIRDRVSNEWDFGLILNEIESNLSFDFSQNEEIDFFKFINLNKLNLKISYKIAQKNQYKNIKKNLDFLQNFQTSDLKKIEQYLNWYLDIHIQDIELERKKIFENIKNEWFDVQKNDIYAFEKPKHEYNFSFDGTVDLANKKDIFIYKFKEDLIEKDKIKENPYFLFVSNKINDYFIWRRYYKDAIMSYTSNFARSIRYSNDQNYNYIDLIIKNTIYQKIFIRNSESKNQINVDEDNNQLLQEKIEKTSWIADISNLLTDYQDLIFRSPLKWLVLVEWVAWSGKTNLIFHRIDYLLQEYPNQFRKENIGIIVKNVYLKEYMISALATTDFIFKNDVQVNILKELLIEIIESNSLFDVSNLSYESSKDIVKDFNNIKQGVHKYFIDKLIKNISNLKQNLNSCFQEYIENINEKIWMNNIVIKWLDHYSNSNLNEIIQQINKFEINNQNSFYYNLINFQRIIQNIIEKLKNKWVLSGKKVLLLEEDIETIFNSFKNQLIQNNLVDNKIYLDKQLIWFTDNYYISVVFLINCIFQQIQDREIIPLYDYVLVDEFQDFNYCELYFLKYFYESMVWSWDLTQSTLYHNTNIIQKFEIVDKKLIQDNFRNTLETVKFANEILKNCKIYNINVKRVNRRWNKPFIIQWLNKLSNIIDKSISNNEKLWIAYLNKENVKTIIKDINLKEFDYYYDLQNNKKFDNNYKIYFFDYNNIKWLEFDNVILLDVDELIWDTIQDNRLKLLYIWVTRAIKKLYINVSAEKLHLLKINNNFYEIIW